MSLLVGFGNKARHGKDTIAGMIHAKLPTESRIYSFASALKVFARVLGMKGKDGTVLQALGTEVMRRINPNIWVDVLAGQIEEESPRIALIPDVRFPNEADFIRRQGGLLVHVTRMNNNGSIWIAKDRDPMHSSEVALDDYPWDMDFKVESGNFNALAAAADCAIVRITQLLSGDAA